MALKNKTIFVGMSGGVDSSVSAAILKDQGHDVVGVFIRTWHPDFLVCNEEDERRDAMRVAAHLDIPFLTFDLADVYKKEVADYMIYEYKAGRTPNPDVMCNKEVKFGAFLKKALEMGADYVATGHYAQVKTIQNLKQEKDIQNFSRCALPGVPGGTLTDKNFKYLSLVKGIDPSKDQCYFLWTLKQEQLKHILFPVGHLNKTAVRKLAKKFKLPVAEKKDSQGICFLGDIDLKDFLKHYIKEKKGKVLNEEGEEIGYHDGAVFLTLGERHGFTITKKGPNDGAYFVVGKDIKKNIIVVSPKNNLFPESTNISLLGNFSARPSQPAQGFLKQDYSLVIKNINWISGLPDKNKEYTAQVRYHGEFLQCRIKCQTIDTGEVIFEKQILVAPGQSVVFYDNDICLGGGVII